MGNLNTLLSLELNKDFFTNFSTVTTKMYNETVESNYDLIEKYRNILFSKRENRFLEGLIDTPISAYYDIIGEEDKAIEKFRKGDKHGYKPDYVLGEILSLPITTPLLVLAYTKIGLEYLDKYLDKKLESKKQLI